MDNLDTQAYIEHLEKKVSHLTQLLEVNTVLNSVLLRTDVRREKLLSYLMDAAAQLTDSEGASVLLWNDQTQELYFAATTTDNPGARALLGKAVPLDSIAGTIFRERKIIKVDDAASDPRHYDQVDQDIKFVTRSLLGVPMISKDRVIGVLEVVNKRQLPWTKADRNNLSILASEAAITIEVAKLLDDLKEAYEDISELDKLKSDFIAIASHELRTPLGIVMGYASFLQESPDPEISSQASKVMEAALQLRGIIDNMINLRYVKQKASELQRELCAVNLVLNDVQRELNSDDDARDRNVQIQYLNTPDKVMVDRSRILMAFMNILNNAVRFTQSGGKITIKAMMDGPETVRISITDDGIGLEESEFDRIFGEFYQVEDHMIRKHGGLGIGLSITRAIVEAHGGRVYATSPGLGKGASFTVALPTTLRPAADG